MVRALTEFVRAGLQFNISLSDEQHVLVRGVTGGEKMHEGSVGAIFVEAIFNVGIGELEGDYGQDISEGGS